MINHIFNMFKSDNQKVQSTESNKQPLQLTDEVLDAVVLTVRVALLVGFVVGAMCMAVIDKIVN